MAKLSEEEAAQLKALQDKEAAADEEPGFGGDGIVVLMGPRADSFLEQLGFGGGATKATPPAKKAAPKKATARNSARTPAETEGDGADDVDDEDQGDDGDGAPPPQHRYFR